jgi:hypothetical protein
MINIRYRRPEIEKRDNLKKTIMTYFYRFLIKERIFFNFLPALKHYSKCNSTYVCDFQALFFDLYTRYTSYGLTITGINDERLLELSQSWRIFFVNHFDEIFVGVPYELRRTCANKLVTALNANKSRLREETDATVKRFLEKEKNSTHQ